MNTERTEPTEIIAFAMIALTCSLAITAPASETILQVLQIIAPMTTIIIAYLFTKER